MIKRLFTFVILCLTAGIAAAEPLTTAVSATASSPLLAATANTLATGSNPFANAQPIPETRPPFSEWLSNQLRSTSVGSLTARGLLPETPETAEVGAWKIPVPEVNPLGAQRLYNLGSSYRKDGDLKIVYRLNETDVRKTLSGETWNLSFSTRQGDVLPFLRAYARNIGADLVSAANDDGLVFRVPRQNAVWWCDCNAKSRNRIDLRILRQPILKVNESLTVKREMFGSSGVFRFAVELPGQRFTLLQCRLSGEAVGIRGNNDVETPEGTTLIRYQKYLDAAEYRDFTLYDLPQDPGWYEFSLEKRGAALPESVTIKFEETTHALPQYKSGGYGTLIVKNVPVGKIFVTPQSFVEIRQGGKSLSGCVTREWGVANGNDVTFRIPAGYYSVVSELPREFTQAKTQLVPVSAGEQTVVQLPESWVHANRALTSRGDDRDLTGEIVIHEKKDLGRTAEISLSVSDPQARDIFPTRDNTTVTESGVKTEIIDIRREIAPCSIALVIDSSGSMKKDMRVVLEAAKHFLLTLPENSFVRVIDFDSAVRELKGNTVKEVVKSLSGIKAEGATKLYDATIRGIELVKGKTRPAVVVFTDGVDSREDKRGTGSTNSREQADKKIAEAEVPVFTIGFGKRLNADETLSTVDGAPDIGCLTSFASISCGQYYPAKDPEALPSVFTAIGSRLGNNFVLSYRRPVENNIGNTPVVSIVIDNSGSMNSDPKKPNAKDGNFRMEKTKQMVRDFVEKLPDKTVMQFTTFQGGGAMRVDVVRRQMSTVSKTNILKAIGEMNPVDGTPIVAALTSAYENLVTIPSQKKVIVFHTDSGLEMEQQYQAEYQKILSKIRDKGIFVLWIGMGITSPEKEKVFAEAAKATNGEYVISESVDEINRRLSALLERLQQPVATREVPLTIEIACQTKQGESLKFKAQNQAAFTPPEKAGTPLEPDIVTVEPGERIPAIDAQSAQNLGSAVISTVANNTRTVIDVCRTAENKAMQLTIKRMTYLDQLFGLDAGRNGMKFVAVDLELKNQTEKHIPYVIPSIFKHFYLGVNGKSLYPASKATWLVEKPITRHGDPSVRIPPDATVSGTLVFHVQSKNDGYEQQSLHFYDSDYGHIQVAVAGEIPSTWLDLAALPSGKPANLSDTFSFHPTAASLEPRISRYSSGDCALFRIVEGSFNSRVQALLNLDPARRIYLRYPTTAGDLLTTLSDVTRFTPLGFRDPVLLAPGSTNLVRFVYDVPSGLASFASELYFDLANGTAVFPVSSGTTYGSPANGTEIDGDLFKIRINELTQLQKPLTLSLDEGGLTRNVSKGSILLDVTFIDKPGNAGTIIPATFFSLVSKSYKSNTGAAAGRIGLGGASPGKDLVTVSKTNQGLIFGINDHFAVFEGQERRAIVVFDDPNSDISNWTLQSTFNGQVHVPIAKGEFHSPELLAWQSSCPSRPSEFAAMLEDAVGAAARMYARSSKDTPCDPTITLEKNDGYEQPIIPPIDLYGSQAMRGVTGEQAFFDLMRTIRCIPKHAHDDQPQNFDYAPESVVTQGFGDIGAVANLAMELLNRLGYSPRFEALEFTDAGARLLTEYYGIDIRREKSVPIGITYTNADRQRKTYVIPFMREMTELSGLVYRPHEAVWNDSPPRSHSVTVSVFAVYSPSGEGSAGATAGDAGSALGGGSGSKQTELRLLQKNLRLDRLSHDAIDLCFAPLIIRGKTAYRAMLFAPAETISAERLLENFKQITSIRIEISGINRGYSHTFDLAPDRKLEHVLMTIGINLPDLPRTASKALHDEFHLVRSTTKNPEPFTLVRLHNRQTLYRLIAGQTAFDHEFVHPGSLLLGRINRPRCIMVTSERNSDGSCTTWIDLLQPFNEIHAGDEGLRRSYNLLNGFFQSSLESKVFPADKRMGYLDVWRKAPKEAELLALPVCNNRGTLVTALEKSGTFPTRLLQAVKENKKVLFFPSKPTTIAGQNRFAWLEIDPVTFEVLSVFNNGCHGGSAEFSMLTTSLGEDTREFVKGAWIGVNVSVWSVAGVALKTQSTAQILTEAKALALKVGAMLAEFQDNVGKAKEFYDKIGELEEQADAAVEKMEGDGSDDSDDTDYGGKAKESFSKVFDQLPRAKIFGVSVNDKIKDGFRGFSNGYNTAVDSYFHFFSGTKKHVQVEPGGSK